LINNGADVHQNTPSGVTPLHLACTQSLTEIVSFLIEQIGVKANIKTKNSLSQPCHVCSKYGSLETLQYLIEKCNIDPREKNSNQEDCLLIAIKYNKRKTVNYLLKQKKYYT